MLIVLDRDYYDKKNEAGEVTGRGFSVLTGAGSFRCSEATWEKVQPGMIGGLVTKTINVKGKIVIMQDFVLYHEQVINRLTK